MATTIQRLNLSTSLLLALSFSVSGCVASTVTKSAKLTQAKQAQTATDEADAMPSSIIKQPQPSPALVANITPESHAEITQAISQLLSLKTVRIAPSAFSQHHQLTLEHAMHKDANGNPIMGRNTAMPEQFSLLSVQGKCVLRRDSNHEQIILVKTQCRYK